MLRVQSFLASLMLKVKLSKISEDQPGNYKYLTYNEIQQLLAVFQPPLETLPK